MTERVRSRKGKRDSSLLGPIEMRENQPYIEWERLEILAQGWPP